MADTKISGLIPVPGNGALTDEVPVNSGGISKKTTIQKLSNLIYSSGPIFIDASFNMRLGALPNAWNGAVRALEINGINLWSNNITHVLGGNIFFGAGYTPYYESSSTGAVIGFNLSGLGGIQFQVAPSGIAGAIATLIPAIDIDLTGRVKFLVGNVMTPVAFAALPANPIPGQRAVINNCNTSAFFAAANSSGALTVPVFYTGTSWVVA